MDTKDTNKMRTIKIEKISLNMGVGSPGDNLEKALKLLNKITNEKPVKTKSKKRIPTWGIRPNLEIGCKVTLRGKKAEDLLKRLLIARKNELGTSKFDNEGNFSFGVTEYISIPDVEYDASIGIIGFEVAVTLQRAGYRIKRRAIKKTKIPRKHRISKDEAIAFVKKTFNTTMSA